MAQTKAPSNIEPFNGVPRTIRLSTVPENMPRLSADGTSSGLISALSTWDGAYTVGPRYFKLPDDIRENGKQGEIIEFTSRNLWAAAALTAVYMAMGVYSLANEADKQIKAYKKATSYKKIAEKLKAVGQESTTTEAKGLSEQADSAYFQKVATFVKNNPVDTYVQKALVLDKLLSKDYENVIVDGEGRYIKMDVRQPKPKRTFLQSVLHRFRSMVNPVWLALSNASFAYWILWIAAGVFTGVLGVGVMGVPALVAFGVPLLLGLTYPIVKTINYFRRDKDPTYIQDVTQIKQAEKVANTLTQRALDRQKADLDAQILQDEIDRYRLLENVDALPMVRRAPGFHEKEDKVVDHDHAILMYATLSSTEKAALTFTCVATSMYVAVQYAAWIITDFCNVVLGVANLDPTGFAAGIALGVTALAMAGYQAYKAYHASQADADVIKAIDCDQELNLSLKFAQKQAEAVANLKKKVDAINQLMLEVTRLEKEKPKAAASAGCSNKQAQHTASVILGLQNSEFLVSKKPLTPFERFRGSSAKAFRFLDGGMTGIFFARLFAVPGTAIFMFCMLPSIINPMILMPLLILSGVTFSKLKYMEFKDFTSRTEMRERLVKGPEEHLRVKQQLESADLSLTLLEEKKRFLLEQDNALQDSSSESGYDPDGSESESLTAQQSPKLPNTDVTKGPGLFTKLGVRSKQNPLSNTLEMTEKGKPVSFKKT